MTYLWNNFEGNESICLFPLKKKARREFVGLMMEKGPGKHIFKTWGHYFQGLVSWTVVWFNVFSSSLFYSSFSFWLLFIFLVKLWFNLIFIFGIFILYIYFLITLFRILFFKIKAWLFLGFFIRFYYLLISLEFLSFLILLGDFFIYIFFWNFEF